MTAAAQLIDHKPISEALAALANRLTKDHQFAHEFYSAMDSKNQDRAVELAKETQTATADSSVEFHASPGAIICICHRGYCICLIKQ